MMIYTIISLSIYCNSKHSEHTPIWEQDINFKEKTTNVTPYVQTKGSVSISGTVMTN